MNNCVNNSFGNQLLALSSSLSIALSNEFSADDLDILAAFFSSLGDNLALLSATKSLNESKNC